MYLLTCIFLCLMMVHGEFYQQFQTTKYRSELKDSQGVANSTDLAITL